jgi:hypothetical protein
MSYADPDRLRAINTFPKLVKYLKDELEWPIESDDFENLTFDYSPEELGLDHKTAVKVKEIKQLRPLASGQPWGIFFLSFEPKRLPVVVLRLILQALVLKKRMSAAPAHQKAWHLNDLLFISTYGELDHRDIAFAHFAEEGETGAMSTLKVLAWDDEDTDLHVEHAHETLKARLHWPADEKDLEAWRARWSSAFTLEHRQAIKTSKELSVALAAVALQIRKRVNRLLKVETDRGAMHQLMAGFKEALIHDLTEDDFADVYAQTITYGLLAGRIERPKQYDAGSLAALPVTNPFLRDLLSQYMRVGGRRGGINFDQLRIGEVTGILNNPRTDMEAVLRDFGDRNPQEDPVVHFYELFLTQYDPEKRTKRGVFYTPRPVVSYIVRSVHELLQTEFGLEDGLADTATWGDMEKRHGALRRPAHAKAADPFVRILDPATGTGTFLVECIAVIYKTMVAKWRKEGHYDSAIENLWNAYVPDHLLPRLFGFELMVAPYAIAHMKVGLKLHETGYAFDRDERAQIYLTNSLEPPGELAPDLPFDSSAIAHEAQAVNAVKKSVPFTVVIGNPPYSGISANMQPAMRQSIDPYRSVDGNIIKEKGALQFEKNLNDDYIKFIRFAESKIESTVGVMGFITNNAYLESTTLRGLRSHLLTTFSSLWFLDLHGDADKRETTEDNQPDENVFDIKHGVAVSVLVRMPQDKGQSYEKGAASRDDVKGSRNSKYPWLLSHSVKSGAWTALSPRPDRYQFAREDHAMALEYEQFLSVKDMLAVNSTGFESGRDEILTAFTKEELREQLRLFCTGSPQEVKGIFNVAEAWGAVLYDARRSIFNDPDFESRFLRFLFNPFDIRWCFFRKDLLKTNSYSAGKHLCFGPNIALMVMRQVSLDSGFTHVGVSKYIVNNRCFYSTKGKVSYFPIELFCGESDLVHQQGERLGPNVQTDALEKYARSLHLEWANTGDNSRPSAKGMTIGDVVNYFYAVLHSPAYRSRYGEFLKIDFPRIPLTPSLALVRALAKLGAELVALHLVEFLLDGEKPKNAAAKTWPVCTRLTEFIGKVPSLEVEKVSYAKNTVWLDKVQSVGFKGVPEEVWNFHVGGYQVCEKWLKDRKGRRLMADDVLHYHKIVTALSNTIRLMKDIDKVIDKHGGWPGAFSGTGAGKQ